MRCFIVLTCLAFAPPVAFAQQVQRFPKPARSPSGEVCVSAPALQVCRGTTDGEGHVTIRRAGRETVRWSASAPGVFGDLRVFRLGPDVLLVAVLDAVSNGLAVSTWTLTVTDGETVRYSFIARDFDPDGGSFGTWNRQLVLWGTEWQDMDDPSGRRGPGYYLVGRPFMPGPDGLVPVTDLPIRVRRLLHSFQRGPGGPVAWLSDRRSESLRHDPFWSGRPSGTAGILTAIEGDTVTVRAGDQNREIRLDAWNGGEDTGRFGDEATGRLFPPEYRPSSAEGEAVRVGAGPQDSTILWLVSSNGESYSGRIRTR